MKKYLGLLLIVTGAFVLAIASLKQGYSPESHLFPNFLLGLGVSGQGVAYMLQGNDGSDGAYRRKRTALVFMIYYVAVVVFMLARR